MGNPLNQKVDYRQDDKEGGQDDGKIKEKFLRPSTRTINRPLAAKSAAQRSPAVLEEHRKHQEDGNDNLNYH